MGPDDGDMECSVRIMFKGPGFLWWAHKMITYLNTELKSDDRSCANHPLMILKVSSAGQLTIVVVLAIHSQLSGGCVAHPLVDSLVESMPIECVSTGDLFK